MLKTKIIALAVLTVFLASVGAVGVASAQDGTTPNTYYSNTIITGYGQITQPGKPINVAGQLFAGTLMGGNVKVYTQRVDVLSQLFPFIKPSSSPVLVATVTPQDWGKGVSVSFDRQGDYYVYAIYGGGEDIFGNYFRPSQSEMMAVKVTKQMAPVKMNRPTLAFFTTSNDKQVAYVGDKIYLGGLFRSFAGDGTLTTLTGMTASIYVQYKAPGQQTWGAAQLADKSVVQMGGHGMQYPVTKAGDYRFQMKFGGNATFEACASNYVDIQVLTPTPDQTSKLSLGIEPLSPSTGQSFSLQGTLQTSGSTPQPIANGRIVFQTSTDNVHFTSQFSSFWQASTSSSGAYSTQGYFDTPGTYYVRAVYGGSLEYTQAVSPAVKVTVQQTTAKTQPHLTLTVDKQEGTTITQFSFKVTSDVALTGQTIRLSYGGAGTHEQGLILTTQQPDGSFTATGTFPTADTYGVHAEFAGNDQYSAATSNAVSLAVYLP